VGARRRFHRCRNGQLFDDLLGAMKQGIRRKLFAGWHSGFVRWASFVIWLLLFFGGLITVGSPNRLLPEAVGWVMLTIAAVSLTTTMNYWVHLLPVLFGYGALNGLIAAVNGHLGTDVSKPISRAHGGMMTACFVGCALLTARFRRPVTVADRLGILGAFAAVVFGAVDEQISPTASILMFCAVLAAVVFDVLPCGPPKRRAQPRPTGDAS